MSVFEKEERFWHSKFEPEDKFYLFPHVQKSSEVESGKSEHITFTMSENLADKIKVTGKGSEMATFIILLSGLEIVFQKYSGDKNLVIGLPMMDAHHALFPFADDYFPYKVAWDEDATFRSLLNQVNVTLNEAIKHLNLPFTKMIKQLDVEYSKDNTPMIHTIVAMEELHSQILSKEYPAANLKFTFNMKLQRITLDVTYNPNLYTKDCLIELWDRFQRILTLGLDEKERALRDIELLTEEEKHKFIYEFNDKECPYPDGKTICGLFEEQVLKTPNEIAVVCEDEEVSYRELNSRANQLAWTLLEKGLKTEDLVCILAERSVDTVVGILAILKAGGAYVPIDPTYPIERIQYMLEDSGTRFVLLAEAHEKLVNQNTVNLFIDDSSYYSEDVSNPHLPLDPASLAYIIYTSGTTGKPKGTLIEHKNVVRLLFNEKNRFDFDSKDVWTLFHSFCFDFSVWEMYGALLYGGKLVIVPSMVAKDPVHFRTLLIKQKVTILNQTPTYFYQLMTEELKDDSNKLSLRKVIFGGEALNPAQLKDWRKKYPAVQLINMYGITETTVHVTYKEITEREISKGKSNIGRPLPTLQTYILNQNHQLQPIGIQGELYVAGSGLARGYINRPELTAEKFIDNPFFPGEKMYKTGDLARLLPDGNLEYLGRIDQQVKIRGYRIEIGEIEAKLLKIPFMKEVHVQLYEDEAGQRSLCAYYVADEKKGAGELRNLLSDDLPAYMIPSYFIQLEAFPITFNGKLDTKSLPSPKEYMEKNSEYVEPRNEKEKILAGIWEKVLGIQQVGIDDNFFDLGGDSIKFIQVSSKLYQVGYRVEMKDLFKYPTIALISPFVTASKSLAEQGGVSGDVPFTPIQSWFFEKHSDIHHFNQSVMLFRESGFKEDILKAAFEGIIVHHDALRMVIKDNNGQLSAYNRGVDEGRLVDFFVKDFRESTNPAKEVEKEAEFLQTQIELNHGPLVKVGLFKCPEGDHLLIIIHHLVVDGVSWRILLEDLQTALEQLEQNQPIKLPEKTDSFKSWSERLIQYGNEQEMKAEAEYWSAVESHVVPFLPKDTDSDVNDNTSSNRVTIQFTKQETENLLKNSNRAYNTEINDLLLAALGMAVRAWAGVQTIKVNLEGHGREQLFSDIDISRTIGWFTSQYPIIIETKQGSLSHVIKNVKEGLRRVPDKGIGYGIYKYVRRAAETLNFTHDAEISFNYLGQFDQDLEGTSFTSSSYSPGNPESEQGVRPYVLDFNGMVIEECLNLSISYSREQYFTDTIEDLASHFRESLKTIIDHCVSKEDTSLTPSDVMLKGMTIEQLDDVIKQTKDIGELEDIYELTPMQKGMWFHHLFNQDSTAYFEQAIFEVNGRLDRAALEKSLNKVIERHAVLRTNFDNLISEEPMQIVVKRRNISIQYHDIRDLTDIEKENWFEGYVNVDKAKGFDLARENLMRMSILQVGDQTYKLLWSFHHILMDGWCIPIVTQELLECYHAITQNRAAKLNDVIPYSQYINWLRNQNDDQAKTYWSRYLEGYEGRTDITGIPSTRGDLEYSADVTRLVMDKKLTAQLKQAAKKQQVTVNTFLQTIWGIQLQKINQKNDVVFGSVVSGRPDEIVGIENTIGLFINSIPVRVNKGQFTTFNELVKEIQKQSIESHKYDSFPLYEMDKKNLISHLMIFENYPLDQKLAEEGSGGSDLTITHAEIDEHTNYPFNLTVIPGEEITFEFHYNKNYYDSDTIEQIQSQLLHLIEQVVENPQTGIEELSLLTAKEREIILHVFNDPIRHYDDKPLHKYLEEQALETPNKIALVFQNTQLTYQELNEMANQLARTLVKAGLQPGDFAGVMLERSPDMFISIYAVLKAGAAYIPIDPLFPRDRVNYMLKDSNAKTLITKEYLQEDISYSGQVVCLDDWKVTNEDKTNLDTDVAGTDLAYVIYTSGSTGLPKGVMISHHAAANFIKGLIEKIDFNPSKTILAVTTICFDIFFIETILAFSKGLRVVLANEEEKNNPVSLIKLIIDQQIDMLQMTPSRMQLLFGLGEFAWLAQIKDLMIGGEPLPYNLLSTIQNNTNANIFNLYGPTETTVFSAVMDLTNADEVSVGSPIVNTRLYILGDNDQLLPIGMQGELCISGWGVANGYHNKPELTLERFVPDPFHPGLMMYRTGDLARWKKDGRIEFLGRSDFQVKIRGYRIELGEIEAQLTDIEGVQEGVVAAIEEQEGDQYLCAYYVSKGKVSSEQIKEKLSSKLPYYMIPSYIIELDSMPLTPNGKINRKELPNPKASSTREHIPPNTEMERALAGIWMEVLNSSNFGIKDDFFDIGGHSLKATALVSKIQKSLQIEISLKDIFKYRTLEEMAEFIQNQKHMDHEQIPTISVSNDYPVSSAQRRMYLLSQHEGGELRYNMPGVLKIEGGLNVSRLEEALIKLIERHESLRTRFNLVNGEIRQQIYANVDFAVEYVKTDGNPEPFIQNFIREFNLKEAPLFRVGLLEYDHEKFILIFDMHHIISDGVSMTILTRELWQLYEGEELPPLRIQYKEYAVWQQNELQQAKLKEQEAYWLNKFSGELPQLELPTDYDRPLIRSYEGAVIDFSIEEELYKAVEDLASKTGTTLYMVLLASYFALLSKYSGQEDIVVGTPISGRNHSDLEQVVGMFVNTLAIRSQPEGNKTFREYLTEIKAVLIHSYESQDYPFDTLINQLNIPIQANRSRLFDTLFVLQNFEDDFRPNEAIKITPYTSDEKVTAKFDLTIYLSMRDNRLSGGFEYSTELFSEASVKGLIKNYLAILSECTQNPDQFIKDIALTMNEKVDTFNLDSIELTF